MVLEASQDWQNVRRMEAIVASLKRSAEGAAAYADGLRAGQQWARALRRAELAVENYRTAVEAKGRH